MSEQYTVDQLVPWVPYHTISGPHVIPVRMCFSVELANASEIVTDAIYTMMGK